MQQSVFICRGQVSALGRSGLFLKLEIWKKVFGLIAILSTMWFDPLAIAYSAIVTTFISQIINSWPNKKLLNYSYPEQLKDISKNMFLSVIMGAIVYCVIFLNLNMLVTFNYFQIRKF